MACDGTQGFSRGCGMPTCQPSPSLFVGLVMNLRDLLVNLMETQIVAHCHGSSYVLSSDGGMGARGSDIVL